MRGVRFETFNTYGPNLWNVLKKLPVEKYLWKVSQLDFFIAGKGEKRPVLGKSVPITAQEFAQAEQKAIESGCRPLNDKEDDYTVYSYEALREFLNNNDLYLIAGKFEAYVKKEDFRQLNCYADFMDSGCEMTVFVIDAIYVDVYCKSKIMTENIRSAAKAENNGHIEDITDPDDCILDFHV